MERDTRVQDLTALLFIIVCVWAVFALTTGIGPFFSNQYHSYALQAQSWLDGRLDLGQNYSYLELAVFGGKYYVSFPPFPSMLLLPFVALFGAATPDHLLGGLALMAGGLLAYETARKLGWAGKHSLFAALFLTLGGNLLFVGYCGWVWFFAQTLSFLFTMGSFYFALSGTRWGGLLSLLFLCCAAGCRPFQMVYLPLVLYLLWQGSGEKPLAWARRYWVCCLPAVALGVVYMALNYARFGSVLEFGHNYLPEFTAAQHGQFSLHYLSENLVRLFRLPPVADGRLVLPQFDGFNFLMASPLFLVAALCFFRKGEKKRAVLAGVLILLHLLALCLHKTMGGWQFGNRYTADALPAAYLIYLTLKREPHRLDGALCLFGFALNLTGTVLTYLA